MPRYLRKLLPTVAMTEPTTEMATEETTTEAIEDTSSMGMGDYMNI